MNSIEEDIKIVENYLAHSAINETDSDFFKNGGWETVDLEIPKSMQHILFAYKRVLKENERYKKSDYETICLENNELREITDRIQSEYNDLLKDNFKLKNELETKRKEYQETYKDVREELRELRKENEELKIKNNAIKRESEAYAENMIRLDIEKQDYFEKYRYHLQQNESLTKEFSNVIPIQKIKDIIDRIDYDIKKTKEIISNNSNIYTSDRRNDYQIVRLRAMNTKSLDIKKRLQELLESEE